MSVPIELRSIPKWVCASNDSKIPMKAFEYKAASCSDPNGWSDYESACKSVEVGNYDSVGFVFNNDGYVVVDIDDCVDGGVPNDFAMNIILELCSYTEVSRSGTGIHIICKSDIPFDGKNNIKRGIEIYKNKRYVILTGNTFMFEEIADCDVSHICEAYFNEEELRVSTKVSVGNRYYQPSFNRLSGDKIDLSITYPSVMEGGRNHSLTSYAGYLRNCGYNREAMYRELMKCNKVACVPPIAEREVKNIIKSICRYS